MSSASVSRSLGSVIGEVRFSASSLFGFLAEGRRHGAGSASAASLAGLDVFPTQSSGSPLWHTSAHLAEAARASTSSCAAARQYPALAGLLNEARQAASTAQSGISVGSLEAPVAEGASHIASSIGQSSGNSDEAAAQEVKEEEHAQFVHLASGETIGVVSAEASELMFGSRSTLGVCRTHIQQLEHKCALLRAENLQLHIRAEETDLSIAKARELNLRLGREVQQTRRQLATAERRTTAVESELSSLREEFRTARRATKIPKRKGAGGQPSVAATADVVASQACLDMSIGRVVANIEMGLEDLTDDDCPDSLRASTPGLYEEGDFDDLQALPVCSCNSSSAWGCDLHSTYSPALLLGHREMSKTVAQGAPGLSLDCAATQAVGSLKMLRSSCLPVMQ